MKTSLLVVSISLATLCMSFDKPGKTSTTTQNKSSIVKQTNSFNFLRLHRQGKGVTATWTMSGSDDVTGFIVQRTYEDATDPWATWEDLDDAVDVRKRSCSYHDREVFPGVISYRVIALTSNGPITSDISSIRIKSRH